MAAAVGLTLLSAYGSIKQGQDQRTMYRLQAEQTRIAGERQSIQYEFQANQVLRKVNATNAAVVARGFAGGVQGFTGSSALLQAVNETRGGREFAFALQNSTAAQRGGLIQGSLYEGAGDIARNTGYFDAAGKLGMAAAMAGKVGSAPSGGASAAPSNPVYGSGGPFMN